MNIERTHIKLAVKSEHPSVGELSARETIPQLQVQLSHSAKKII